MLRIVLMIALASLVFACSSDTQKAPAPDDEKSTDPNRTDEEKRAWRECRSPGWLVLTVHDVDTGKPVTDADHHALRFALEEDRVEPMFPTHVSHPPAAGSETGSYRWKLAEGWHQIRIDADGYRDAWTPVFRIEEGKETPLEIRMRKANRLKVVVLDENGRPIQEGGVHLQGDGYRAGMHIAEGVGERLVPVDEITITVGDVFLKEYALQSVTVPLKPGILNEVTIRLRR